MEGGWIGRERKGWTMMMMMMDSQLAREAYSDAWRLNLTPTEFNLPQYIASHHTRFILKESHALCKKAYQNIELRSLMDLGRNSYEKRGVLDYPLSRTTNLCKPSFGNPQFLPHRTLLFI